VYRLAPVVGSLLTRRWSEPDSNRRVQLLQRALLLAAIQDAGTKTKTS
jgi:hypothetical protein